MAVTSTASKTTAEKNSRVQNQAMRMMTGAMKTTPIRELETTSGLPTLENRQNSRVLTRAVTFKRLHSHPMAARMSQPTKKRLKGSSFIHQSRIPEKRDPELLDHEPKAIPQNISISSWKKVKFPVIKDNVQGIENKRIQSNYPQHKGTHVYTDGSATAATRDGGGGVYIRYEGEESSISLPTGRHSTNFKAEAPAESA